ncbi:hypothetical protein LLO_1577 [Legionella longbeachae NSW150]|uniref:Uncharacterized protein n=1 Tax=Legionella longbeachae serogroup 1 (strain NSW150) TaxID=661367 RepID=D3HSQ7_LEGLN|nr:hypothetical protein LLB_0068 [Legionella longbeachae D-4968]CBJ11946.1 hypothetical protein LLO_1577 [Legionella longbeachae NSW150]
MIKHHLESTLKRVLIREKSWEVILRLFHLFKRSHKSYWDFCVLPYK